MSSDRSTRPVVGVTMGDAAGIGPEIVIKALTAETPRFECRCVVIGDAFQLERTARELGSDLELAEFAIDSETTPGYVEVYDLKNVPPDITVGIDAAVTGKASAESIETAVCLWRENSIDAICTAPISKKALRLAGYEFPGHTEFLAYLTDTQRFAMSFFADKLRVVLLSTHMPLVDAIGLIKKDRLVELIRFADLELEKLLSRKVTIAIAGLNPHASEGGMFGTEEANEIEPAVDHCRSELGIDVTGPYSPDTVFLRGHQGEFDACLALYHDQATIAVKSLTFGSGVNVTLGLPLIRTSVDHGTAYDIAGKGVADASSLAAAIKLAGELARNSRTRI